MKKFKVKVFLIAMILIITGGMVPIYLSRTLATETGATDEFSELLGTEYESEAPTLDVAELSSTFTSEKEIEVYLTTTRNDIDNIVISGWSGGAYSKYKSSKTASYDETREIYTVTFNLDEIVNTNTNEIDNADEITYYFDACVYGTNGTMSYYNLDNVCYTSTGFTTSTISSGDNVNLTINAVEDGEVAILSEGEEVTENTKWQSVSKGENTISLMSLKNDSEASDETVSSEVQTYQVLYKAASTSAVTSEEVEVTTSGVVENISSYQDDETYKFEISEHEIETIEGEPSTTTLGWISYTDTPEIFESTIQGKSNETATAKIQINTEYQGILSFDYMVSSEEEFDIFTFDITGATPVYETYEEEKNGYTSKEISGLQDWVSYSQRFKAPSSGVITLTLTYSKDKNVNRNEDKAAIRNLKFTPLLPTNGKVIINNGDEFTDNINLILNISVDDGNYMYISEEDTKPTLDATGWLVLEETYEYTLTNVEDGEKTIYVWFKDENGAMSLEATKATIKLDGKEPSNTAPTLESTATEIKVKLNQTDANTFKSISYGYKVANLSDEYTWIDAGILREYTITGLTEKTEYAIVTKASDGVHEVTSESTLVKTKIESDGIAITKTPAVKTLEDVDVTIKWNNTTYDRKYSLDNINWIEVSGEDQTSIHMSENGIIYYMMTDGTYDTGILEYVVDNIDRNGPKVESIGVVTPVSGKYGIDDEITIKLQWDEEVIIGESPVLNIKFDDGAIIPLTKVENDETTITYKYKIVPEDSGYLVIDSITGGLVYDTLNNEADYKLPAQEGSTIFAENAAYIAETNTYYATLQNAIKAAGTKETTIKIVADTKLRGTAIIKEDQNITIDLNGKTISIENDDTVVTAIENNGTLKIIDTSENSGTIKSTSKTRSAYTIINKNTGKLNIEKGLIEAISNSTSVALESYAIYNKESGEITLRKR